MSDNEHEAPPDTIRHNALARLSVMRRRTAEMALDDLLEQAAESLGMSEEIFAFGRGGGLIPLQAETDPGDGMALKVAAKFYETDPDAFRAAVAAIKEGQNPQPGAIAATLVEFSLP